MEISKKQVEYMADLARLKLTKEETEKFAKEFSEILSYIEKLNEVDVSKVEPMTGGTDLTNKMREDEVSRELGEKVRDEFIKLAPEHSDEFIETISPLKQQVTSNKDTNKKQ